MISVAVIFDNLGPYHVARLRGAAAVCQLSAIEVAGSSATYAWKDVASEGDFRRVTLVEKKTSDDVSRSELSRRLRRALAEIKPDVVFVPGWASPAAWAAMAWCAENRVRMMVMSESTAWDEPRTGWKEWVKSRLIGFFQGALVGGTRHRDYLVKLGMPAERIFLGYDAIDNAYFVKASDAVRMRSAEARRELGLPEHYFLASARFVQKKNLLRLFEAYALYRQSSLTTPWSLVLLGDGELRAELHAKAVALGLQGHVHLPGFRQYPELPAFYALAGAFIHPSTIEPWGLVVNEAMASGLPVLVSNPCGCVPELVREEDNGFIFDPLDAHAMAGQMQRVAASDFPLAAFAARSRGIVAEWGPGRFADGLSRAVDKALSRPMPLLPVFDRGLLMLLMSR